jgi:hypothetical protein
MNILIPLLAAQIFEGKLSALFVFSSKRSDSIESETGASSVNSPLCFVLFGAFPDQVSSSRPDASGWPGDDGSSEFIPGNGESRFSIDAIPIRESTALNVTGNGLICLTHRVRTEIGKASLHDGLVFLCTSCLAIVRCEFGKIRPSDDDRKMAVSVIH